MQVERGSSRAERAGDRASEEEPIGCAGPSPGSPRSTRPPHPNRERVIDATLRCLARHGTIKTTVDDIAREASVSRATVYRTFPGGRDELLAAVVDTEVARLVSLGATELSAGGGGVELADPGGNEFLLTAR